jgi:hypothetical protein
VGEVDAAGKESLTTQHGRRRFDSFHVPEHVLVVNYLGTPVTGTLSFWGQRGFNSLRKHGPNDGISLLADMMIPGGVTLADLENDHFMRGKPLDIVTVALAITVIDWLEHPDSEIGSRSGKLECLRSGLGASLLWRPGLCFAIACSGDAFGIFRWNHS